MDVALRPVNERFLDAVLFPAFSQAMRDVGAGLEALRSAVHDPRTGAALEAVMETAATEGPGALQSDTWLEVAQRLLFAQWAEMEGGWQVVGEPAGYAGGFEDTLQ